MKTKHRTLPLNQSIGIVGVFFSYFSITATAHLPYAPPVTVNWQPANAYVSITDVSSGSLQKNAGGSTAWNACATGNKAILRDGYVQFKAVPGSQARLGLSLVSTSDGGIDYAIEVKPSGTSTTVGTAQVVLNGSAPANNTLSPNDAQLGNYDSTTTFTIQRFGSVITFSNSSSGYSRSYESKSTSKVLVDCSFYKQGSAISEAKVYIDDADNDYMPDSWEGSYLPPLHDLNSIRAFKPEWDVDNDGISNLEEFVSGTSASDSLSQTEIVTWPTGGSTVLTLNPGGIKKQTPGTTATYNAKAIATNVIEEDGQFVFRITPGTITTVGLNTTNTSSASTDLEWAIITAVNGGFVIRHNGTTFTPVDPLDNYTADTVFAIRRTAGYIQFFKDGTEVLVSVTSLGSSGPLYPSVWLSSPTAELTMARIDDGNIDNDELPDVWERAFLPPNSGFRDIERFAASNNADEYVIVNDAPATSGDEVRNGAEFIGGTSPIDSLSRSDPVDWSSKQKLTILDGGNGGLDNTNTAATYTARAMGARPILGDGVFAFQVSTLGVGTFGLNTSNVMPPDSSVTVDVEWGFITSAAGTYQIKPNGTPISPPAAFNKYNSNTRFAIRRIDGVVQFLKDDVVVHTETPELSAGPLYPNVWIQTTTLDLTTGRCYTGNLDNDKMPDAWELEYLSPDAVYSDLNSFSENGNPDVDDFDNWEEFYDGTSPNHPLLAVADVSWTTAPANTLTNTGSTVYKHSATAGWNANAVANQRIGLIGSLSFRVAAESSLGIGLTVADGFRTREDLEYMILLTAAGQASVYESPGNNTASSLSLKVAMGDYDSETRFSIRRNGGTIQFFKDGQLYYTSSVRPTASQLLVDTSFNTQNSKIISARIFSGDVDNDGMADDWELDQLSRLNINNPSYAPSFTNLAYFEPENDPLNQYNDADNDGQCNRQEFCAGTDPLQQASVTQPVSWNSNYVPNATDLGGGLIKKNAGVAAGFNAGSVSLEPLAGDGVFCFSAAPGKFAVGLTYANDSAMDSDCEYAFILSPTDIKVQRPEGADLVVGVNTALSNCYSAATVFAIRRQASVVDFLIDGVVVYSSITPSDGEIFPDCSIYTAGDQLSMARVSSLNNYEGNDRMDGMPIWWKIKQLAAGTYKNFTLAQLNAFDEYGDDFDNDGVNNYEEFLYGTSTRSDDTDDDGMSDRWEIDYGLNGTDKLNTGTDADNDGLSNLQEYNAQTNPRNSDTDNDGLIDGDETTHHLTNPLIADTDLDKIPDGYEVSHQLSPTNPADGLADADGDRVPNLWEYFRGYNINDKNSKPAFDATVNPALSQNDYINNQFKTLDEACNYLKTQGNYLIVECKKGLHYNRSGYPLHVSADRAIAWLGELGGDPAFGGSTTNWVNWGGYVLRNTTVIDGITIGWINGSIDQTTAISTAPVLPNTQIRFVNTIIRNVHCSSLDAQNNLRPGALINKGAEVWFVNSTITSCASWQGSSNNPSNSGPAIYNASGKIHLINSVVWDSFYSPAGSTLMNSAPALPVSVTTSVVQGVNNDPHLNPFGLLTSESGNCIMAGTAGHVLTDIHGELRNTQNPCIGAHEWLDSDNDNLPDQWEKFWFNDSLVDAIQDTYEDNDGLDLETEYLLGTKPTVEDSDSDGLNDGWEDQNQTNPLLSDGLADPDGDLMTNSEEYALRDFGLRANDETDGLSDMDGDAVPNAWETAQTASDSANWPQTTAIVTPNPVSGQTPPQFATLQAAANYVSSISGPIDTKVIIRIRPGIYDAVLSPPDPSARRRIAWLAEPKTAIQGDVEGVVLRLPASAGSGGGLQFNTGTYMDGIILECIGSRKPSVPAIKILPVAGTRPQVRLVNTIIRNWKRTLSTFQETADSSDIGGAIDNQGANVFLAHCTLWRSAARSSTGTPLRTLNNRALANSPSKFTIHNSILWDDSAGDHTLQSVGGDTGAVTASSSSNILQGVTALTPQLSVDAFLTTGSPARGAGAYHHSSPAYDIHFFARSSTVADIGAMEWSSDSYKLVGSTENNTPDSDILPDWWELWKFGNLIRDGTISLDSDTLTDAEELEWGTNPTLDDTDGDSLADNTEIQTYGTNPIFADSDSDGMPDNWELTNGSDPLLANGSSDLDGDLLTIHQEYLLDLNPYDENDGFSDKDGDSLPNSWDCNGPGVIAIVTPNPVSGQWPEQFASIQAAYDYVSSLYWVPHSDLPIVEVTPGVYDASLVTTPDPNKRRRIAWIAKPKTTIHGGVEGVVLRLPASGIGGLQFNTDTYMDGFIIEGRRGVVPASPAVRIAPLSGIPQVRLVNTIIRNWNRELNSTQESADSFDTGGAIDNQGAKVFLAHCTLWRSAARSSTGAPLQTLNNRALASSPSKFTIHNSIIWDDLAGDHTLPAIGGDTGAVTASTSSNILQGITALPPQLSVDGFLTAGSPALSAGVYHHSSPAFDIHFFARSPLGLDIGAMEWSSDSYKLAAASANYTPDNDTLPDWWELWRFNSLTRDGTLDFEGDTLTDAAELLMGTDPTIADSDGDGAIDSAEDFDEDGLNDHQEFVLGLNLFSQDSDGDSVLDAVDDDEPGGGDGLNNLAEFQHGTNRLKADTDDDDLTDLAEVNVHGTNPVSADSESDGIPDGWEISHTLNPLVNDANIDIEGDELRNIDEYKLRSDPLVANDALEDTDGDRIPDLYEVRNNSDPLSAAWQPVPHKIVNSEASAPLPAGVYTTIQAAINSIPKISAAPQDYYIVKVMKGTYTETVKVADRRIVLFGEMGGSPPVLGANNNTDSVTIEDCLNFVADGFIITHMFNSSTNKIGVGCGVVIELATTQQRCRLVNCIITGNVKDQGAGLWIEEGKVTLDHCTITGNKRNSLSTPTGLSAHVRTGGHLSLLNSILWNQDGSSGSIAEIDLQTGGGASVNASSSIIQHGGILGSISSNPSLDPWGYLTPQSSNARNAGSDERASKVDILGTPRDNTPDIGAHEYRDIDNDGLPDWWELQRVQDLSLDGSSHTDGDSLINSLEYALRTDPQDADTDDDDGSDSDEYAWQTNPLANEDNDADGMSDVYEFQNGLRPYDYRDSLEDKDGDRIPNLYEYKRGKTLSNDANSKPIHDVLVDSSQISNSNANIKTTISAALYRAKNDLHLDYPIILVNYGLNGVYPERIVLDGQRSLLLGEGGPIPPTVGVSNPDGSVYLYNTPDSVLDGFIISYTENKTSEPAVNIFLKTANDQARLINCIITGYQYGEGAAVYLKQGELTLSHCTIFGNKLLNTPRQDHVEPAQGIKIFPAAKLYLQNSIVWNDIEVPAQLEIDVQPGAVIDVTRSIIRGGGYGGINLDPRLDHLGRLGVGSPAINFSPGVVLPVATTDIHGEPRDALPDIGADEFFDSDNDSMPDRWELVMFGDLGHTASGHADSDGLDNFGEYIAGTNPLVVDTDSDGINDLSEAVANAATHYYYAGASSVDTDGDGLTLAQEQLLGSNPNALDSNGDGVSDSAAWRIGLSINNNDPDGDGLDTSSEHAKGTSPVMADTDGDGVSDFLDKFPLDPSESDLPTGDTTDPVVVLTKPTEAVLQP